MEPSVAEKALDSYLSLQKNWDSYGAEPPNEVAVENAKAHLEKLRSMPSFFMTPTAIGGVGFGYSNADHTRYCSLEFDNEGGIMAIMDDDDTPESDVWEVQLDEVPEVLERMRQFLELKEPQTEID